MLELFIAIIMVVVEVAIMVVVEGAVMAVETPSVE